MKLDKGYHVIITSWENDADAYNTTITVAETKEFATFLVEFAKLFAPSHSKIKTHDFKFDNLLHDEEQDWDNLIPLVRKFIVDNNLSGAVIYPGPTSEEDFTFKQVLEDDKAALNYILDLHYDLFGSSEYFGWRVFEKSEVYYFSEAPTSIEELSFRR